MKRTHTAPGVAPPAPGAVCPPARSGEYALSGADQDDVPTVPNGQLDPDLLKLVRIVGDMPPVNKRRFVRMVEAYSRLSLDDRVISEEVICALARGKGET